MERRARKDGARGGSAETFVCVDIVRALHVGCQGLSDAAISCALSATLQKLRAWIPRAVVGVGHGQGVITDPCMSCNARHRQGVIMHATGRV